ncbi:MAG TPA: glycogen debranching N-terminal domain-containing protein [bacterium]|nr:glycogen debranching N-terminal domain-containing protein [bacterium]
MPTEVKAGFDVITVNHGQTFMVTGLDGIARGGEQQGLFTRDVRFLSHYRCRINGRKWKLVTSSPVSHTSARFAFTNPALLSASGPIPKHVLGLTVARTVLRGVHEDLDLVNYHRAPVELTLEIELGTDFADLFEVRNHHPLIRRVITTEWDPGAQRLSAGYARDGYRAKFVYQLAHSSSQASHHGHSLLFDITLPPGGRWHTCAHLIPEMDGEVFSPPSCCHTRGVDEGDRLVRQWRDMAARIRCSDAGITSALEQASDDLVSLLMNGETPGTPAVLAAGIPYFVALFGRDSLIAGLQTLATDRAFSLGALGALAAHQATADDDFRDADPGKILHELRVGELARFGQIPHTPYYGSADATLLYPILLHEVYMWAGDHGVLTSYLPTAERCLSWMDRYGDRDGDGFQEYRTRSSRGIKHQGWKDSGDGVVYGDGRPVEPPVALCELQGYVYDAKRRMAVLYEAVGDSGHAARLRQEAESLAERFNEVFWLEDEGTYAFGLDARKERITSIVSNAGHCLWSGIVPPSRAERVVARLLADDMWSGWGIRTLSAAHPAFNPFAYQRGAVWPHDNALIAAGCKRYGHAAAAAKIARGVLDTACMFQGGRLPELLSGHQRKSLGFPVQYLGANVPQAWASGSLFLLLQVLLGLNPDAPHKRLYVAPTLPPWLDWVEVENLRVGEASISLRCWREGLRPSFEVRRIEGSLTVLPRDEAVPLPERS